MAGINPMQQLFGGGGAGRGMQFAQSLVQGLMQQRQQSQQGGGQPQSIGAATPPAPTTPATPPGKPYGSGLFDGIGKGDALFGLLHTQDPAKGGPRYKFFPNAPDPKPNQFPMDMFMGPSTYAGFFKNGRQQTLPTKQYGYGNAGGYNFENSRHGTAVDQRNWGTQVMQDWAGDTHEQVRDWWQQRNWDRAQAANAPVQNTLQQPQSIQGPGGPGGGYPIDQGAEHARGVLPPAVQVTVNGPRRLPTAVPVTVNGPRQMDPVQMAIDYILKTRGVA